MLFLSAGNYCLYIFAGTPKYPMISRIIAENLKRNGIYQEDLIACGLAQRKVTDLFDSSSDNEKILAFNNSDLLKIVPSFRVGYDLIFTGM